MPRLRACAAAFAAFLPIALLASAREAPPKPAATSAGAQTKVIPKDEALRKAAAAAPRIELALLLDTSNSMDGLINQARAQLWKIVNDLATAEKAGKSPSLRVALYEYGNQGLPSDGGFVRQVVPFTDDLDKVSEELFALTTNGGDEYCGRVIESATTGLDWSRNEEDLKLIVIAGNEPFTQGPVDYKKACAEAIAKGIVINTIFCGDRAEGIQTGWEDGAKLSDGTYSHINQDQQIAEIATPFDDDLARLSGQINGTFLFFGTFEARERLVTNQAVQDTNAAGLGAAIAADRALTKGGRAYNFQADLVQLYAKDGADALKELKDEELPAELKGKSEKERDAYLKTKVAERETIQKQINELAEKRKDYIAAERKKQTVADKDKSLDEALLGALRVQAEKKNFSFEK